MSSIEDRIIERVENVTLYPSDFSNLPELLKEGSYRGGPELDMAG